VRPVSTRDFTEELAEEIVPDGRFHKPLGRIIAALLLKGPTCYEHCIEKAALNWMHVYKPTLFLGPFLNPKKSKLVVNFII
jgi:hypothetical protein